MERYYYVLSYIFHGKRGYFLVKLLLSELLFLPLDWKTIAVLDGTPNFKATLFFLVVRVVLNPVFVSFLFVVTTELF